MAVQSSQNKKILVVEDDQFLLKIYQAQLASSCHLLTATNGKDAIDLIKKEKPDLVLLDLIIPQKNGFEVLEEMKAASELATIPVIVLSNLSQETDREKAKKLGAIDYIVKANVDISDIVEKIKQYL